MNLPDRTVMKIVTQVQTGLAALKNPFDAQGMNRIIESVKSEFGEDGEFLAGTYISMAVQRRETTIVEKVEHMGDKFDISGNVNASAVGQNAQVQARDVIVGIKQTEATLTLADAHSGALEAIQKEPGLSEAERVEARGHADSLKAELEKPEHERNQGFIKRCGQKLSAAAEPAGAFFGAFLKGYLGSHTGEAGGASHHG